MKPADQSQADLRRGLAEAAGAYGLWGVLPLYLKQIHGISPYEVVAQRIVWSLLLMVALVWLTRRSGELRAALARPQTLLTMLLTACLIGVNWLVYIWAVYHGHIIAASLGYFLNPLFNVLLGYLFLKERLRPWQLVAVALAASGVALLAFGALDTLWISLTLAVSFASYGLIRKLAHAGPMVGLTIETILLAPVAALFLLWWASEPGRLGFGHVSMANDALLIGAGAMTAVPLLLFAAAAKKLQLTTIGIMQFMAPTLQFLIGVLIYQEPLSAVQLACFTLIWAGLALFTWDGLRTRAATSA